MNKYSLLLTDNIFIIVALISAFIIVLFIGYRGTGRNKEGKCARCGIDLSNVESHEYKDGTGSGGYIIYSMCPECFKKSKRGPLWLWVFGFISFIIVIGVIWYEQS